MADPRKRSSSRGSSKNNAKPRDIVQGAIAQLPELIGKPVDGVSGMEKDGSEWVVTVEVVELERVPNTTDVLGSYRVTVDGDGDITSARRTRRYYR